MDHHYLSYLLWMIPVIILLLFNAWFLLEALPQIALHSGHHINFMDFFIHNFLLGSLILAWPFWIYALVMGLAATNACRRYSRWSIDLYPKFLDLGIAPSSSFGKGQTHFIEWDQILQLVHRNKRLELTFLRNGVSTHLSLICRTQSNASDLMAAFDYWKKSPWSLQAEEVVIPMDSSKIV